MSTVDDAEGSATERLEDHDLSVEMPDPESATDVDGSGEPPDGRQSNTEVDMDADLSGDASGEKDAARTTDPAPEVVDEWELSAHRLPEELPPLTDSRRGHNLLSRLLFFAAGADRELLVGRAWQPPFYNRWDVPYFTGVGGAVFVTATLAGFAVAYALSFALAGGRNLGHYAPVGIVAALAVFNIDRLLVSDPDVGWLPRAGAVTQIPTVLGNAFKELLKLLPRLAITGALGLFTAQFLLLAFYAPDISNRMRAAYLISVDRAAEAALNQDIAEYNNATADLNGIKAGANLPDIDPMLSAQIDAQRTVIKNEESNVYGTGPTCGGRCDGDQDVLKGYIAAGNVELSAYNNRTRDQGNRDKQTIKQTRGVAQFTQSQARILGEHECQFRYSSFLFPDRQPLATAPRPADLPKTAELDLSCPSPAFGLNDQLNDLKDLDKALPNTPLAPLAITGFQAGGVLPPASAQPVGSAATVSNVNSTENLIRASLIGIDVLPVLTKFLRALFRKRGYYLMLDARQDEVDQYAETIRGSAVREHRVHASIREREADVRQQLANIERERHLRTVSDARTRLGLRRIEGFIQDMLRRESDLDRRSATRPPITPPWATRPPPAGGWVRMESPYDNKPRESPDDPRSMPD